MSLERLKLTVAFDGRPFSGWQSQPNRNGIQDHLIAAVTRILGQTLTPTAAIKVHGAGRTDAGVHALAQVAHVDVPRGRFTPIAWRISLNALLPPEIRILRVSPVPFSFHAQHSVEGKVYRYRIWVGQVLPPLELGRAWHVPQPMSFETLQAAAALAEGTHDFASFAANRGSPEKSTVRTLFRIKIRKRGPLLGLEFAGTGFLYRMVRMLTGSLIQVSCGRSSQGWFKGLFENPGKQKTNYLAPACGLYLARVIY